MSTLIALLRGINVGGRNIVPMAELRSTLAAMGLCKVRTYIQSGNVVFRTRRDAGVRLRRDISRAIETDFGCAPHVQLLTSQELATALRQNPFADRDAALKTVHLMFLSAVPDGASLKKAEALAATSEACALRGKVFYLYAPDGVARSAHLKGAEKALGVHATARNLRSVQKIHELASD